MARDSVSIRRGLVKRKVQPVVHARDLKKETAKSGELAWLTTGASVGVQLATPAAAVVSSTSTTLWTVTAWISVAGIVGAASIYAATSTSWIFKASSARSVGSAGSAKSAIAKPSTMPAEELTYTRKELVAADENNSISALGSGGVGLNTGADESSARRSSSVKIRGASECMLRVDAEHSLESEMERCLRSAQ